MKNNLLKYTNKIALIGLIIISIIFTTFIVHKYIIPDISQYITPYISQHFLLISIGFFFVIWFPYFLLNYNSKKKTIIKNTKEASLLSDNPITLDDTFIEPIVNIINAHSFTNSFSMALIGKWGSGKSSYLKTLEKQLTNEEDYEVISINVWQLENSENITHELKKELDNIIFKYNKVVWLTQVIKRIFIQDYFAIISNYLTKSPLKVNFAFEPTIKDSKENLKNVLNDVLDDRKIILLIDELDRIDSEDDILNIFKIIHYVDDFNNIFSITAMDIEQIEKKIEDINYIHKIFNLKYPLPTIDKDKIIQYYRNEIFEKSSQYIKKEAFKSMITSSSVLVVILNYRVIKNSFNDTMIFISSLQRKHSDWYDYISFEFVFLLNLIKAVNFEFYSYMILNQKLFILIEFSKIKDTDEKKKIEHQKEFFEKEFLLENLSKGLNFERLLTLLELLELIFNQKNINQFFDIYQSYTIGKYHITEERYLKFQGNLPSIKEYYTKLEIKEHKGKFIKGLLEKTINSTSLNIPIVSEVIKIFLENDDKVFKDDYSKYFILTNLTNSILINKMSDSLFTNLLKNEEVGYTFINKLLFNFLHIHTQNDKYHKENIFKLIKNYLKELNNESLNEKIESFYKKISILNSSIMTEFYEVLYPFSKNLLEPNYHSIWILQNQYIENIKKLIDTLNIENIDDFIKDEYLYDIHIGNSFTDIFGEELKDELKKLENKNTSNGST